MFKVWVLTLLTLAGTLISPTGVVRAESQAGGFVFSKVDPSQLALPIHRAGMFAGQAGAALIVGGGLDERGKPCRDFFLTSPANQSWTRLELKYAVAYSGVAADAVGTLYLAGGFSDAGPVPSVVALKADGTQIPMPALPQPVALGGAGLVDGQLYVIGGVQSFPITEPSRALYRLNLKHPGASWETLPPMPGPGRILPGVIGFYQDIAIFGGFIPSRTAGGATYAPVASAVAYRWKAIDGTTQSGWRTLAAPPAAVAAPIVFQTGHAHVAVAGGLTRPIQGDLIQALATSESSRQIMIYHDTTDTWITLGQLPEPLALGVAASLKSKSILIGRNPRGETAGYGYTLQRTVRSLNLVDYIVLGGYFAAMCLIGLYFSNKNKNSGEFALGNRTVPWWAGGISMFATGASSISFMAIPAQAFRSNLVFLFPTLMLIPLFFVEAYIIYPIIRRLEITSTYEYLERRYHPSLRYIASAQCIALQLFGRINIVLLLPAMAIAAVTGLNVFYCVLVMGLLTTIYTSEGGFKAVIWTDVTQGIISLFSIVLMIALAILSLPHGTSDFIAISREYGKFDFAIWSGSCTMPLFWIAIMTPILNKLAFASDQPVVQRVFATPLKDVRKLALTFLVCSVAISALVNLSGISIFSYFHAHPEKLDPAMSNDQIIPLYIVQRMPIGIAGLIIAGLFAAAMSATSSSLNSVSIIFLEDFYRKFKKTTSDRERLVVMKVLTLVCGLIGTGCALFMAKLDLPYLFQTWNELFALLGGGFLGIYILGIFTRRTHALGAMAGALASIVTTILVKQYTSLHWYFYMPSAVFTCLGIGYFLSLLTPGYRKNLAGLTIFDMKHALLAEPAAVEPYTPLAAGTVKADK